MKVTKELLAKYVNGLCNEEERQAIEEWLPGKEDITASLSDEFISSEQKLMWQEIISDIPTDEQTNKVVPFYKTLVKYAVAASAIIGIFGTITFFLKSNIHTFIASNEGRQSGIVLCNRNSYKVNIKLDESFTERRNPIKITNISLLPKCISTGKNNTVNLVVKPHHTYYLMGTYEKPYLIKG